MSQHFQSLEGGESLPNFNTSLRSRVASIKGDDDEEDEIEDNDDEDGDQQAEKASRHFWSLAEEQVLVNSWLQVSQDKYVGSNHKGNTFWNKVFYTFDQVRRYRNICWAKRVQGISESDLLKEREMEPLRSRWKRIDASVSKFVGTYAHAEARRTSGQCDDDVMKIALTIYKSDSKNHKDFQYQHCWDILRGFDPWKPVGSIVKKCNKKTTAQEGGGSKRSRINEDDNFSTSTNPNTPTSGDIDCFIQPPSDGSVKNNGKGKVMNMPPDALQQWVDYSVSKMNLSRTSETKTELARLKYNRDVESKRVQREREKILVKQRKINMELFKVLSSKAYLTEDEEELKKNLIKVLFSG